MARMPSVVARDMDLWLARVPLIHFWIVSYYYPDRVMRQFGLSQSFPPPLPLSWDLHLKLDDVDHTSCQQGTDWRIQCKSYIDEWIDVRQHRLVQATGLYDISTRRAYMRCFETNGMRTVYLERYFATHIDQPRPAPSGLAHAISYVPRGDLSTRQGFRAFKDTIMGIKYVMTRGLRKVGKIFLKSCRGHLEDVGQGHRLDRLLMDVSLPTDIDSIPNEEIDINIPDVHDEYTKTDYQSLYDQTVSFVQLLNRSDTYGTSSSQPLTPGYPHTQDGQDMPSSSWQAPSASVPEHFEFDISVDDAYVTPYEPSGDEDCGVTTPLAQRRER